MRTTPLVKKLDSGYWYVWWSREMWAQWQVGEPLRAEDFFHPAYGYSASRAEQAEEAVRR